MNFPIDRRKFINGMTVGAAAMATTAPAAYFAGPRSAHAQFKPKGKVPDTPFKTGHITFLTGPANLLGEPGRKGHILAAEEINAEGGLLGKRKIETIFADEAAGTDANVKELRRMKLSEKIDLFTGVISSGNTPALGPVAEELGVLTLFNDGCTDFLFDKAVPKPKYVFRVTNIQSADGITSAVGAAKAWPQAKRVASIQPDYSYGRNVHEHFMLAYQKLVPGSTMVSEAWPKLGATDFTAHITKLISDKPDVLICGVWGGDYVAFYKQALRYGLFEKMKVATTLAFGGQPHAIGKDHPEGVLAGCHSNYFFLHPGKGRWPINDAFVERYLKRWNEYPSFESDGAYASLYLLKAAVEKANLLVGGWPEEEAIIAMLEGMDDTPAGYLYIRPDNHQGYKDCIIGMTKNDPKYDFPVWDLNSVMTIPIRDITAPPNWPKPGTTHQRVDRRSQLVENHLAELSDPDKMERPCLTDTAVSIPSGRKTLTMHRGRERPTGPRTRFDRFAFHRPIGRAIVKITAVSALCAGLLAAGGQGGAGHQVGHYPSYYPDEIRIDVADPAAAGKALTDQTLHAYVGTAPNFTGPVPGHLKSVKSLGSFLVLTFNTTDRFASADARCTAARGVMAALRDERAGGFVFHPYPVTPFHADYLHHLDRIETITGALADRSASAAPVKVSAKGSVAEAIVRARLGQAAGAGELTLEVVPVDDVLAAPGRHFDGRSAAPWIKEGWFHAYRLLASGLDATSRRAADEAYDRLIRGEIQGLAERTDLERRLVAALTSGCQRLIAGYVLKEEFFNDAYPEGVENIAYDSTGGFNSPVFVRTVKLKDYPWNGKLHLAVREPSKAAWNPIGGFTDVMGRLIWSAIGDPAMIPFPDNSSWMPNRVQSEVAKTEGQSGGFKLPPDAIAPQPGSGLLQRVSDRAFSSTKVVYEVLTSPFEDGSAMTVGDLLYPFAFAGRWGAPTGGNNHEPRIAATFADLQERLVGLKVVRIEKTTHTVAEGMTISADAPVVEVYLRNAPGDERQIAALAAPWSTIPWHLLALMEEAVVRGYAAFSQEEAARRRVPWLDLVRDQPLRAKLLPLIAQFEKEAYRPEALKEFVPAEEARLRWRSLREFAEKNGHLLVANGPYRLKQWGPDSVVLDAVRELTYPLGFGTFDRFVNPPHATIEAVTQDGGEITARASVEMVMKMGRKYQPVKEPLLRTTARGVQGLLVVSRYLLIDPDGKVLNVDKMQWQDDGLFTIKLPERMPPGQYTVILGIFPDGNFLQPSAKILKVRLGAVSPG